MRLDIMKELLTASTPRLEGALLPAGEEVLLDNGHAPVLRRVRRGAFEVRLPAMKRPEVYAVKFNGERAARIPTTSKGDWLHFSLAESPSPFFEIVDAKNNDDC